ncbi:hypothetical protein QN372_00920 [Undibacterium sp. RTI2.1]|nr:MULTISPECIES: hypothetical protein [unclassified Undibacterium]MDY7537700.1 hypothetical protein [Undibacterium sp. 5I1]MEB0029301.1 hypothetical protein [Undibacterium sp. RTI2.1]MEB0115609.1 hypothetical protein [Undibacterium sp. RTI2.2]MEB0230192.1 hypothetical protein [Undibacterium sp. 10I3]MEB0256437.1 hypothetical protein [Undibacterium sp. 5I1]
MARCTFLRFVVGGLMLDLLELFETKRERVFWCTTPSGALIKSVYDV